MRQRSLKSYLARQWLLFAFLLSVCFLGAAVLALYILEDYFLDEKLKVVAAEMSESKPGIALPTGFQVFSRADLPADLRRELQGIQDGWTREFRRDSGRYVHVLWREPPGGPGFALVYDVTEVMTVNQALQRVWVFALLFVAFLLLCAYAMAGAFVRGLSGEARRLLAAMARSDSPAELHSIAQGERIAEFAELAQRHAEVWAERLAALARERETLAFLAHELRTPLQSARASLALLMPEVSSPPWQRLARALNRLERASAGVLWLASESQFPEDVETPLAPILDLLCAEFQPLAEARACVFERQGTASGAWPVPSEVAEAILGNVLLNAIQHGAPGTILVRADAGRVSIVNALLPEAGNHGWGLGTELVRRLAEKFRLEFARGEHIPGCFLVCLRPA
ncbi:MAG: HAMP domain-containing histidine kinase [Gammaproteobacteria bacterium]|nr:HAMP domain-containing histidine kinase [Gammaproteobacteria bacterium]